MSTRLPPPFAEPAACRRSRRRALLALAALAALLHGALLDAIDGGLGVRSDPPARQAAWVSVRTIAAEASPGRPVVAAESVADPATAPVGSTAEAPLPSEPQRGFKASARSRTRAAPASLVASTDEPPTATREVAERAVVAPAAEPEAILEAPPLAREDAAAPALPEPAMLKVALDAPGTTMGNLLAPGERPPSTYRTVLPAPATLRYELRRSVLRGSAEIRWRPAGDRYALQFEARLAGLTLLAQSSQGELAATGLAPVRFVDQRARKAARSVNFSRESGTISFSASTLRWPLLAGTQDRLSWMIQLGGIVAADPALATSGRISMVLVSARGEAAVRTARFAGRESAETVSGSVPALRFVVDGHSAYDGSFEIWLDPARGYLPVRATSRNSAGDAEFELLLQRTDP